MEKLCFRLLAEIDDIVGENVNVTNDHMTRLPFMSSLIKETLRFYSPVSALIRETKRETNFGGFILPKSALAMVSNNKQHVSKVVFS